MAKGCVFSLLDEVNSESHKSFIAEAIQAAHPLCPSNSHHATLSSCFFYLDDPPGRLREPLRSPLALPGGRLLGPRDGSQWTGLSLTLYTVCLRPRADPRTDPSAAAVAFLSPHLYPVFRHNLYHISFVQLACSSWFLFTKRV